MQNNPSNAPDRKLRLLFVVDGTYPNYGGAETQARKLARAMIERGHEVRFVTPQVVPGHALEDVIDGCPVQRIAYPHIRLLGGFYLLFAFAWYLIKHRDDYDVIHVHITRLLAGVAGFLKPIHKTPVITKISGFYEFNGGVLDQQKRWRPVNFLIRRALTKIDYFQTISVETEEKLLGAGFADEQIRFIPNGIDTVTAPESTVAANDAHNRPLVIGYCGRLREVKGVHILLSAFAETVKANPERELILRLAGDGFEMEALRQQAKDLGVDGSVEFLGMLDDVKVAYKTLDYYVQPSFAEGLPNAVIEAMLGNLPVVVTAIGGNTDLVEDGVTGLLFPAGDHMALAACLQRCLDDPQSARRRAEAGRQKICEIYGFDVVVDQLLDVYQGRVAA